MAAETIPTLLIVDKPAALDALKTLVGKEYKVLTASDAAAASAAMAIEDVHIMLVDQHLPVGTGLDFLLQSRTKFPTAVRMLFVKDDAEAKAASVPLQQGAVYRVFMKPCRPSELKSALRNAAELHRLREERRTLRSQLEKAGKLRLQGLALLARELRTPVTYVNGVIELMQLAPDPEQVWPRLEKLGERTRRLGETVEHLVRLLEAEQLAGVVKRKPVAPAAMLSDVIEGLRPYAEARRQEVVLECPPTLPEISAFAEMLTDALTQLILTAIMVSPEGAKIRIAAGTLPADGPAAEINIEVTDAGEIIPETDHAYIFEPFYFSRTPRVRADGPEARTGLHPGLAAVRRYIALHGGKVELKQTSPAGSTFQVRIPLKAAAPAPVTDGTAAPAAEASTAAPVSAPPA